MKKLILVLAILALFPLQAAAEKKWEYKVIFLPGTNSGSEVAQDDKGAYIDSAKTKILNKYAEEGWEIIAVTGASGADHAIYLKRPK